MNKFLALLYFSLIFSSIFCKECTDDDTECSKDKISEDEKDHYICVPKNDDACELVHLCDFASASGGKSCSDYPTGISDKTCDDDPQNVGECHSVYKNCEDVPYEEGKDFDCSLYPVTDKEKFSCENEEISDPPSAPSKPCKEVEYVCNTVPKSVGDSIQCSDYSVGNTETHYCGKETVASNTNACKEIPYCEGNTEGDCTQFQVSPAKIDTHVCIADTEGSNHCKEQYLCNKVPSSETAECNSFVVSEENKYTHKCASITGTEFHCREEKYSCNDLPKITGDTSVDCSDFLDSTKSDTHICVETGTTSTEKQCKEMKLCSAVEESDMEGEIDCSSAFYYDKEKYLCRLNTVSNLCEQIYLCSQAPSDEPGDCSSFIPSDEDHVCVSADPPTTNKCREKPYCSKVPKPAENADSFDCSIYQTKNANHICIQDLVSNSYACKEEYLCAHAPSGASNEECAVYPVQKDHKNSHGCIKDEEEGKSCKEESLCRQAVVSEANDEKCAKYPVSFGKINTHICIKNPEETGSSCIEQPLCESVEKQGTTEVECSNYPVKNKDNLCVKNTIGENPCKEMLLCNKKEDGTSDEECRKYPVSLANKGINICIKNPNNNIMGCIEEKLCDKVPKADNVDCSKYPVSDTNKNTHACNAISNPTDFACEEVAMSGINCLDAKKGDSDEQCSKYKKSSANKQCIKNTQTTGSPCIEKELSPCELKTSGASDEICNGLAVEKEGEQKCVKDGDKCIQLTYCKFGIGNSDNDCSVFALENKEKECKKKKDENKCEEVEKKEEISATDGDDTKKSDEEKTEKSDEEKTEKSDETKVVDSTSGKENNSDGVEENKDTTKEEKGNSGYYLKGEFSLLLLIALL